MFAQRPLFRRYRPGQGRAIDPDAGEALPWVSADTKRSASDAAFSAGIVLSRSHAGDAGPAVFLAGRPFCFPRLSPLRLLHGAGLPTLLRSLRTDASMAPISPRRQIAGAEEMKIPVLLQDSVSVKRIFFVPPG